MKAIVLRSDNEAEIIYHQSELGDGLLSYAEEELAKAKTKRGKKKASIGLKAVLKILRVLKRS